MSPKAEVCRPTNRSHQGMTPSTNAEGVVRPPTKPPNARFCSSFSAFFWSHCFRMRSKGAWRIHLSSAAELLPLSASPPAGCVASAPRVRVHLPAGERGAPLPSVCRRAGKQKLRRWVRSRLHSTCAVPELWNVLEMLLLGEGMLVGELLVFREGSWWNSGSLMKHGDRSQLIKA